MRLYATLWWVFVVTFAVFGNWGKTSLAAERFAFKPDFAGIDLLHEFPQLRWNGGARDAYLWIDRVYVEEGGQETLFVVEHRRGGKGSYVFTYWAISIFDRRIFPVERGYVPDPARWRPLKVSMDVGNGMEVSNILFAMPKDGFCLDPLAGRTVLHRKGANRFDAEIRVVAKVHHEPALPVGGDDCSPPVRSVRRRVVAEGVQLKTVVLPDGSILAWSIGNPTDIIRFDRMLGTDYRSPQTLILTREEWLRLPVRDGALALQDAVLKLFDK